MGNYDRYFIALESGWNKEKDEHNKVKDGLDVLIQLDRTLERAFDVLSSDRYGNMSSYSYSSEMERINKCKTKNSKLITYADKIYGILEDKENDFHKDLSKVMENLSLLDIEDYEIDNTLGIEQWNTVTTSNYSGSSAYNQSGQTTYTYKSKKNKITFSDVQAKTNVIDLQDQFANFLKENGKDGKNISEAEVDKLKKEFYKQQLTTSFNHTVYNDGWWSAFSTTLDYIPLVGGVKSCIEGFVGTTMTGEQLSTNERLQYGLMGVVSFAVDWFTFGTATATVQGTKAVIKEGAKIVAKDVFTGWSLNLGSQTLAKMDLPPEIAFIAHIGLNIAISRSNIKKGASGADFDNIITDGSQITKVGNKKILKPNITYQDSNGYIYKTDELGRITNASGELKLGTGKRNPYAQRTVGGEDRLLGDDGGHIFGNQFNGSGDIDNLLPQGSVINRAKGEYYNLEKEWADAIKDGAVVKADVMPVFDGVSKRPKEFNVSYSIDGEKYTKIIKNK